MIWCRIENERVKVASEVEIDNAVVCDKDISIFDINDYKYSNGEWIYDPIEVAEMESIEDMLAKSLAEARGQIEDLVLQNESLLECILEMSEMVYG